MKKVGHQLTVTEESTRFVDPGRAEECFQGLRNLYNNQELCDINLVAEGIEHPCHRVLLASASNYFHAMLTGGFVEKDRKTIELNEIKPLCLQTVINFLYTGEVVVSTENVQDLFVASHMLELDKLEDACCEFMKKRITDTNCIGLLLFARMYERWDLINATENQLTRHFDTAIQSSEFLNLSLKDAVNLLSMTDIPCKLASEETFCEAALNWLKFDWTSRKKHTHDIMKVIRLCNLREDYLKRLRNNSVLKHSPRIQEMFEQVAYLNQYKNRWHEVDLCLDIRLWHNFNRERMIIFNGIHSETQQEVLGSHEGFVDDYIKEWPENIKCPKFAVGRGGNELYSLNGEVKGQSRVYRYNPSTGTIPVAKMRHKRSHFSVTHLDTYLFVVGGSKMGVPQCSVERYDTDTDKWEKMPSMPTRLRAASLISYQGSLYVFGGETASSKLGSKSVSDAVYCYSAGAAKWEKKCSMPIARAWSSCVIFQKKIYIIGGLSKIVDKMNMATSMTAMPFCLDSVEIYDPRSDSWSSGVKLPKPLASPGAVKYLGSLYIIGGVGDEGSNFNIYHLDESAENWVEEKNGLNRNVLPTLYSTYTPFNIWTSCPTPCNFSDTSSESLVPGPSQIKNMFYNEHTMAYQNSDSSMDSDSSLDDEMTGSSHRRGNQYGSNSTDSQSDEGW